MITVRFTGQIGNQAFQYCIGRILAASTGQAYRPVKEWLTKSGKPVTWTGPRCLPSPRPVVGRMSPGLPPPGLPQKIHANNWVDFRAIDPKKPINIAGYFQRYELFQPWKQQIRTDWLKLQIPFVATDPDAVYIHVRRTDYVGEHLNPDRQCQATGMDEYAAALATLPDVKKLILVSDNYSDPILDEFNRFGLPVERAGGTWDQDFMTLASCRRMIMSQSTFAWWAGYLGRTETIVCPMTKDCFWGRGVGQSGAPTSNERDYVNLHVSDEPERWKWVVC